MERTREKDLATATTAETYTSSRTASYLPYSSTICIDGSVQSAGGSRLTHDYLTPNFKARRAAGEIINNPYDSTYNKWNHTPLVFDFTNSYEVIDENSDYYGGTCSYNRAGTLLAFSTAYDSPPTLNTSVDESGMVNQVVTNAWSKVNQADMLGLTAAAEARKTVDTLVDVFRYARRWVGRGLSLRQKLARGGITATKAASAWLSIRYGLRPIYYDAFNVIKAFEKANGKRRTRFTSRLTDKATDTEDVVDSSFPNEDYPHLTITKRYTHTNSVDVRAGVLVEGSVTPLRLDETFGLSTSWGEQVWELIPYSFIADWFFNTGKTIAAWSPKGEVVPLTSWVVVRTKFEKRYEVLNLIFPDSSGSYFGLLSNTAQWSGGGLNACTEYTERIPRPERPIIPSLSIRLDVMKFLDLAALFAPLKELQDLDTLAESFKNLGKLRM